MGGGGWSRSTYAAEAAKPAAKRYKGDEQMQTQGYFTEWLNPARKPYFESRDIDGKNALDYGVCHDLTGSTAGYREDTFKGLPLVHEYLPRWNSYGEQIQIAIWGIADKTDKYELQIGEYEADNRMVDNLGKLVKQNGGDDPEGYLAALYARAKHVRTDAMEKRGLKGHFHLILDEPGHESLTPDELSHCFGKSMIRQSLSPRQVCQMALEKTHTFILQLGDKSRTVKYWSEAFGTDEQPDVTRIVQICDPKFIAHTSAAVFALTEGIPLSQVESDLASNLGQYDASRIAASVAKVPVGAQLKLRRDPAINVDTHSAPVSDGDSDTVGWL